MFGKRRRCYLRPTYYLIIMVYNNKCNYNMRKCVTTTIRKKKNNRLHQKKKGWPDVRTRVRQN